ncbi:hypothetical protein ACEQPO_24195 [Bacillus sp. SL00103]
MKRDYYLEDRNYFFMHKRRRYIHEEIDDSRRFNENSFCFSSGLFTRWKKKAVFIKVTVNDKKTITTSIYGFEMKRQRSCHNGHLRMESIISRCGQKDSRQLAFILQKKQKESPQLALIQCEGGGVRTLTAIPYGVSHPVFSLDGAFILCGLCH